LYAELRESLRDIDTAPLQGVRVVIDPGHGGRYDGAVGPTGLREADVNLGIALNLWGLLTDAGADATLTRSSDRTVADGEDSSLRDDLMARAAIANEVSPHVFISIHHNSDIGRDTGYNRIETYYKAGDPGPSADAARALHGHLSFNIGETRGGVIPGNYLVLRECAAPAVLGEPSFISNPHVESRLKEAEVQRMEAQAYFLGLLEYFSKGIPTVQRVSPVEAVTEEVRPLISVMPDPGRGGIGIDPACVELFLDGHSREPAYDPDTGLVSYTPEEPLPGGAHRVSARVRNLNGNWSPAMEFTFEVKTKPAHLILTPQDEIGTIAGVPFAVEARAYDVYMNPVADGTPVAFSSDTHVYPDTARVRSGRAICYVVPPSGGSFWVEGHCGEATMGFAVDAAKALRARSPYWAFLRDASDGSPIAGAVVSLQGRVLARSNREGFVRFSTIENEPGRLRIAAPGYVWHAGSQMETEPAQFDSTSDWTVRTLRLRRAAAGLLHGLTFAIDPEGGGDNRAGQGPSGTDASWINFEVAAALASLIENSGGGPVMTRGRETPASDLDRLMRAEMSGASRYIVVSHMPSGDAAGPWIEHYPGSSTGRSLSEALAWAAQELLGTDPPAIRESSRYALRMTSSPAVFASLVPLDDRAAERFVAQRWNNSREAYAIYAALLRHLDRGEALSPEKLTVQVTLQDGSKPARGATVTLDGYLNLVADHNGTVRLAALEPGSHLLEVALQGYHTEAQEIQWPPERPDSKLKIQITAKR
jgi:N-acetylmuramoyl-L-alanine amidase